MLTDDVQRVLKFEMTIAEWIGTAVMLLVPYLVIGVLWTATHAERLGDAHGFDWFVSVVVSVLAWPVLFVFHLCLT
jgi:hypothetical protein